jgi:hypothetical protein
MDSVNCESINLHSFYAAILFLRIHTNFLYYYSGDDDDVRKGRSLRFVFIGPGAIDEGLLLAKIGIEKKAAFYLLRDVRLATAYGYLENDDGTSGSSTLSAASADLRCSHFWDTMQFIDQITQISLDLRRVPIIYRQVRGEPI